MEKIKNITIGLANGKIALFKSKRIKDIYFDSMNLGGKLDIRLVGSQRKLNIDIDEITLADVTHKLSNSQQYVVDTLNKYPNVIVMSDGWITGGHGIQFDLRTVNALKRKKVIFNNRLHKNYVTN
jgi:hypothetical protein